MNNPKVSVVIPVYNTEAYVEQTLRSIMGRGFSRRNLEGYTTVLRELNRFAAPRDAGQRQLIRTLTRQILRPVMRNAWALPAGARWKLAWDALRHYPGSIDGRALATLLFKKPLKKENGK